MLDQLGAWERGLPQRGRLGVDVRPFRSSDRYGTWDKPSRAAGLGLGVAAAVAEPGLAGAPASGAPRPAGSAAGRGPRRSGRATRQRSPVHAVERGREDGDGSRRCGRRRRASGIGRAE